MKVMAYICPINKQRNKPQKPKIMRTTKKEVIVQIQAHVLECINSEDQETNTEAEKITYALDRFNSEFLSKYELKKHGSFQNVFIDWLLGIPFGNEYRTHAQIEILESWGLIAPKGKTPQDSANLYNYLFFREFARMMSRNGLQFSHPKN